MALQQIVKKDKKRKPSVLERFAQGLGIATSIGSLASNLGSLGGNKSGGGLSVSEAPKPGFSTLEQIKKRLGT